MWSIDTLRQITIAAKDKAEQERQREAELARLEALEREQEAQRQQEEKARQQRLEQDAHEWGRQVLLQSIQSAVQLERSFVIAATPEVAERVTPRLKAVGIFCRALGPAAQHLSDSAASPICEARNHAHDHDHDHAHGQRETLVALEGLVTRLSDPRYEHHQLNVSEWINQYRAHGDMAKLMRMVDNTIELIRREFHLSLTDPMLAYYVQHLKPWLEKAPASETGRHEPAGVAYRITLNPREPRDAVMTAFADLPTWMLGMCGSGLMRNIMLHAEAEARAGHNQLQLSLVPAEPNPSRWGNNQMHKVMNGDQPIGVSPFGPEVLGQGLEVLGLRVQVASPQLTTSW